MLVVSFGPGIIDCDGAIFDPAELVHPLYKCSKPMAPSGGGRGAVKALKKATPRGLLVGSPKLSAALQRLDLVDEYRFVVHPVDVITRIYEYTNASGPW
jgi:hypothetical protein